MFLISFSNFAASLSYSILNMSQIIEALDILTPEAKAEDQCAVKTTVEQNTGKQRKLYIESYGCQMNFSDS